MACYIPRWYTRPKTVTHPGTNRARRGLTSFMRRTPLTTAPRRQPILPNPNRYSYNNGAYSSVVSYFHTQNFSRTFSQPSIDIFVFFTDHCTHQNSVIMSLKNKLFKEIFKMSSVAVQQACTKAPSHSSVAIVDPIQPNPTHQKLKNLDPTKPIPWVSPTHGQLLCRQRTAILPGLPGLCENFRPTSSKS